MQFIDFIYSSNLPALICFPFVVGGFLIISASFYMLYHERILLIEQHKARKAAKQAAQEEQNETSDQETEKAEPAQESEQ